MPPSGRPIRHLLTKSTDGTQVIQFKQVGLHLSPSRCVRWFHERQLLSHCGVLLIGSINRMLRSHRLGRLISRPDWPRLDREPRVRHEDIYR